MSSLLNAVKRMLTRRPLLSNCAVYGALHVGAEFSQQVITKKILPLKKQPIDKPSLGRYAVMGTVISAPLMHVWYMWLDSKMPGKCKPVIIQKLILDQLVFAPICLVIFFVGMSVMEFSQEPFRECREKLLPTFLKSTVFWFPIQTLSFAFVPHEYRVAYCAVLDFVWINILCWVKREKTLQL